MQFTNFLILFSSLCCISVLGYKYEQLNINYSLTDLNIEEDGILDCKFLCLPITNKPKVVYTLYTRDNENGEIIEAMNSNSIEKSNFNSRYPTRFLIHGWTDDSEGNFNIELRKTFLTIGNFNIFVVDWRSCSKNIIYFQARCCVDHIGRQVAEFIDFLNSKHSMNFNNLTLIGHSLGAHGVGSAGRNMKNGKAHTIVGLDPAKPCYMGEDIDDRLRDTDGDYVETIHTNGAFYGFYRPVGQASFYPNWGKTQIGCNPIGLNLCSHTRAVEYYAEALLKNNFAPFKCESFDALKSGICNMPVEDNVRMGNPNNYGKAKGIYYVPTNKKKPFGMAGN